MPFGDKDIDAHMDTSSGELVLDIGHLENPDLKVTVDYETAKAILMEGNPQAGMQAFMAGKIRVEGDMAKLMALQAAPPGADSAPPRWPSGSGRSPSRQGVSGSGGTTSWGRARGRGSGRGSGA